MIELQRNFEENLWDQDTPTYLLTTSVNRSKKRTPSGRGCFFLNNNRQICQFDTSKTMVVLFGLDFYPVNVFDSKFFVIISANL